MRNYKFSYHVVLELFSTYMYLLIVVNATLSGRFLYVFIGSDEK